MDKHMKPKSFRHFCQLIWKNVGRGEIGTSSSAIAYYLLFSVFPLIIMIGNLLPYISIDSAEVLNYIKILIPLEIYNLIEGTIVSLLGTSYGGLLSISALTTMWAASRSINALQVSLNKVYGVGKSQNFIVRRILSVGIIFSFMLVMMLLTTIFTFGQGVIEHVAPDFPIVEEVYKNLSSWKLPTTMGGIFLTMCLIYYTLPNVKSKIRYIFPGAIFATLGWMGLTQIFGYYITYFASTYNSYGILGSLIVVLLWLNFAAIVIILGGVLNAATQEFIEGPAKEQRISLTRVKKKLLAKKMSH
ncbi:YihY/virulence factor BrkB family protein [Vagococcus xieshaowenii]|uniref:YihY/virulence factor BrkB family protein n=1 Tax=Vagococcus xieshaowenii TaxID=2562451 RepID=A0AAJ5EE67_9ENTE|nr:YihY/virulence factor BrkB family protein [Vagococcus xieshaowenii]QCA29275.1 YihY/virulence factor BrkB family protein [Vagococcus xieshaowenii]TFZ39857.1 YihY/virulence factor BrkB family protein [Vagococcus xieshaowenii]